MDKIKFEFIHTTDDLKEIVVAIANYKVTNNVMPRLTKEADRLFGEGKWEKVPMHGQSLDNLVGWYARRIGGYDTLAVRV